MASNACRFIEAEPRNLRSQAEPGTEVCGGRATKSAELRYAADCFELKGSRCHVESRGHRAGQQYPGRQEEREAVPTQHPGDNHVPPAKPPASASGTAEPPGSRNRNLAALAPMLRKLESSLRTWLRAKHLFPMSDSSAGNLEQLANDLTRQADALDTERPYLVVMLMGGNVNQTL